MASFYKASVLKRRVTDETSYTGMQCIVLISLNTELGNTQQLLRQSDIIVKNVACYHNEILCQR